MPRPVFSAPSASPTVPVRWPSPHLMRRWMQHDPFYDLLAAINFQADLHLARATFSPNPARDRHAFLATIRLSHYHRNAYRRDHHEPNPFPEVDPEAFARLEQAQGD